MNSLEIDYLPVGEESKSGDAIAIRFGDYDNDVWTNQIVIVIDGGNLDSGKALVNHVKNVYKSDTINHVFLTHPDGDHASGLRQVTQDLKIEKLWMHCPWNYYSDVKSSIIDGRTTKNSFIAKTKESYSYASELEAIAIKNKIEIVAPHQGKNISNQNTKETLLTILGPSKELYKNLIKASEKTHEMEVNESTEKPKVFSEKIMVYEDMNFETEHLTEEDGNTSPENDMSLVLHLNVAGFKILFTGDSGTMGMYNAIRYAVSSNISLKDLNILHVPHHGSRNNISKGILDSLQANHAIVSCAKKGEPHHPSSIVTNALIRRNIQPYATKGSMISWHFGKAPGRGFNPATSIAFSNYVQIPDEES